MFLKRRSARILAAAMALAALMLAPAAQASGPSASGGGGRGGVGVSTSVTSLACTPSINLQNSTGYFRTYAAIWTNFKVTPCASGGPGTWLLTYRNNLTGQVDFRLTGSYLLNSTDFSQSVDDDFGPFSTPYTVTLTITDARGVQTSQSANVTTPVGKING